MCKLSHNYCEYYYYAEFIHKRGLRSKTYHKTLLHYKVQ